MSAPLRFESASSEVLRILLLEDSADDAELIRHALRPLGRALVIDQVEEMAAFREALDRGGYRLVLSDVSLPGFDGLSAEDFAALLEYTPEVVVFGAGARLRFPQPRLTAALTNAGIGVEVMDTGAACRTYNVLLSEDRRVLAAVLL